MLSSRPLELNSTYLHWTILNCCNQLSGIKRTQNKHQLNGSLSDDRFFPVGADFQCYLNNCFGEGKSLCRKYSNQLFSSLDGRSMKPNKSNDFNDRLNGQMRYFNEFPFRKTKIRNKQREFDNPRKIGKKTSILICELNNNSNNKL